MKSTTSYLKTTPQGRGLVNEVWAKLLLRPHPETTFRKLTDTK